MPIPQFLHVIPVLRTPLHVEGFDFVAPDDAEYDVGDLVIVPFRNRPTPALVTKKLAHTKFADRIKPVSGTYGNIHFPLATVSLLQAVAARTFTSPPTVLKAWMRQLPKRDTRNAERDPSNATSYAHHASRSHWSPAPETDLIANAKQRLKKNEHVLILVPWVTRAKRIAEAIPNARMYTNDLNDGDAFRAWSSFLSGETRCIVSTRLGAWMGSFADAILLDEPENDDHKQDELAPRYDARWIAHWCSQHAGTEVETFGVTPRLTGRVACSVERGASDVPGSTFHALPVPLAIHPLHPSGKTSVPMIQGDTMEALRAYDGPRVIIHPVRGTYARLVCRDCGWRATCEYCHAELLPNEKNARCSTCGKTTSLPLTCPSCHGASLNKSWPGLVTLQAAWKKHEPDLAVSWRDLSNESMDAPFPERALVVVTEGSMLGGVSEDIRRRERRMIAFRRLAARVEKANGSLIIQCHEDLADDWNAWLTDEGVEETIRREQKERSAFGYPPAIRLAKIIIQGDEAAAQEWMYQTKRDLPNEVEARGPFPVKHRPTSRSSRWIWHLIFPKNVRDENIIAILTPHARNAIIDLDPVAFFM